MEELASYLSDEALSRAFDAVASSIGKNSISGPTHRVKHRINHFRARKQEIICTLQKDWSGSPLPNFTRRITKIPKGPGSDDLRPISLFPLEERVLIKSVLNEVWHTLERDLIPDICFCTFRKDGIHPQRGVIPAVRSLAQLRRESATWFFETDIRAFFDSIDRKKLTSRLEQLIDDRTVLEVIEALLVAQTDYDPRFQFDDLKDQSQGIPQGAAISPLLACTYLAPFDRQVKNAELKMIRYVDDVVVACASHQEAEQAKLFIERELTRAYSLSTKAEKTKIVSPDQTLTFLGHDILPNGKLVLNESRKLKVETKIADSIRRLPGLAHDEVVQQIGSLLLGYFAMTAHCDEPDMDHRRFARFIEQTLLKRRLDTNRLTHGLKSYSKKWPSAFLESLP